MLSGFFITPNVYYHVLSHLGQIVVYLCVGVLPVNPSVAFQNLRLRGETFLLGIVVVETHEVDVGIGGLTQTHSQQFMSVRTVPHAGFHIFAVGAGIVHTYISVLGINGNGEVSLLIKHHLRESFLHSVSHLSHHPCGPGLVEAFEHDAQTAVYHVIDGFGFPTLLDHGERTTLKMFVLGQSFQTGHQDNCQNDEFFHTLFII